MTEELNLSELFSNFVKFNSRNKKFILIFMAIGVLSVILFQKFKTPYYETKAICMSGISEYERQEQIEDLSQRTAIDLINHLQINIENKDYNQISKVLGIDSKIAKTIKKIEAEQLYQQDMNERFYALNKFEILLIVYDNTKLSDIQNGLIYYFENNQCIMTYHKEYIKSCNSLINDINFEIEALNKFRNQNSTGKFAVGATNTLEGNNKSLSNEIIALSYDRENIIVNKNLLKPLVYVQKFANVDQKEDDILVWSLLAGIICYFIGLLVALIKEVK